jgi:hypothetical protein
MEIAAFDATIRVAEQFVLHYYPTRIAIIDNNNA